jgi:PEP-CTERM motif
MIMLRPILPWVALFYLVLTTVSATAQNDLYDNGPGNGQQNAWTINFGFTVSDNFTLSNNSSVNGMIFTAWIFPDEAVMTGEVAITSSEFGGTTYFDQNVIFSQSGCFLNEQGFNVCTESSAFGTNVNLAAGTYWLTLENVLTNAPDDPVYWDQNSGPSLASQNSLGTIPSESFTVMGSSGSSTGTTPEPGSLVLFASGALGVAGWIRRK